MYKQALRVLAAGAVTATASTLLGATPALATGTTPLSLLLGTEHSITTVKVGDSIFLDGVIRTATPASFAPTVDVIRTDSADPGGVDIATVTFGAGEFTIADHPPVSGTVTYSFSYPGDDTYAPAQASTSITVTEQKPTMLTLNHNGSTYNYGSTVPFTAHLGHWDTERLVIITDGPEGTPGPYPDGNGSTVDANGNYTTSFKLIHNTSLRATYNGDAWDAPATTNVTVYVHASVATSLSRQYKSSGTHAYFHQSANPLFTSTMNPYAKRRQHLTVEYYSAGKWHLIKSGYYPLNSSGKSYVTFSGTKKLYVSYRVRAVYLSGTSGDQANVTTYGAYHYFYFTK